MHPAGSLIVFTVFSGAGFGLLAALAAGFGPPFGVAHWIMAVIGFALAGVGLLSSTFHLGHPERALKAFTQWRSSWLSREAWLSSAALCVLGLHFLLAFVGAPVAVLGWIGALLALVTVGATSMIYAQLRTVPRWHHWSTPVLFLSHALTAGALLTGGIWAAVVLMLATGALQFWIWQDGDNRFDRSGSTLATATGLGARGALRAFEPPHTGPNYLTREMVHVVGRKHSQTLRMISLGLGAGLPAVLLALAPFSHALAFLAILSYLAGTIVGRWLFFAEAEHVVGLYYGKRGATSAA